MFHHSEKLNPCKCGSKKRPDLDSDDLVPCWSVFCHDCKKNIHDQNYTMGGAIKKWNEENPLRDIDVPHIP